MRNKLVKSFVFLIMLVMSITFVSAAADFAVTSFSCSPAESVINNVFSCTTDIKNNGDASGTVNTATLYTDASNWLEDSNYPQASGVSVSAGQSTTVTFSGLRATKSGDNGFSKIMLDQVTDTYVADNNKKVNIINVAVTVSNSVSSAAMSSSFTTAAEVTAGGNIDVSLTFTVNSGGCSIGNQDSEKIISDMQDGNKQSRTWTVTQGTSGDCKFTISAAATGSGGIASKIDSTSSTITCTTCPVDSGSSGSSSGSSGGSAVGGSGTKASITEFTKMKELDFSQNDWFSFKINGGEHKLTVLNITDTYVIIELESEKQAFTLNVGDEIQISLTNGEPDISIKLKSINVLSKKAVLVITRLSAVQLPETTANITKEEKPKGIEQKIPEKKDGESTQESEKKPYYIIVIVLILILLAAFIEILKHIRKDS